MLTPLAPSNTSGAALGLNDKNDAVGFVWNTSGEPASAVLFTDGRMIKLNKFLPPQSDWVNLREANAINNSGDIVGQGLLVNGDTHAFLLTHEDN